MMVKEVDAPSLPDSDDALSVKQQHVVFKLPFDDVQSPYSILLSFRPYDSGRFVENEIILRHIRLVALHLYVLFCLTNGIVEIGFLLGFFEYQKFIDVGCP